MTLAEILKWTLNAFEFAAACTGLYYWNKWKNTYWKWFTIFLIFIFLTELVGKYLAHNVPGTNAKWYRYVNIPVYFLFLLWILGKPFEAKKIFTISRFFMVGYIILFLIEEYMYGSTKIKYSVYSYQFGSVGILILSVQYFLLLTKNDNILYFKTDRHFWVSAGLILYMVIMLPFRSLYNLLDSNNYHSIAMSYWYISFLFNYTMYSFFTLGTIWGKAK